MGSHHSHTVTGIRIFRERPVATRLVISSSSQVFTFLITSELTSSTTEIKNGGISTFTVEPHSLYLPALKTCFRISERVEPLKISRNFFVALSVIYRVDTSGAPVVSGPLERPEISKLGSTFFSKSEISKFCTHNTWSFTFVASSLEYLLYVMSSIFCKYA
jgi:hypothetical protein